MRTLLIPGLGFVLGAFAASIVANTLARRDAYQRATMQVLQHQYGTLRERVRAGSCANVDPGGRQLLVLLGNAIEASAYPGAVAPPPFREYASRLQDAIAALPGEPTTCQVMGPALSRIGQACDACHQQYR